MVLNGRMRHRVWPSGGQLRWLLGSGLSLGLVACGEGAPPLDELSLRDALGADPEVIAALPEAHRRRLAERFEEAAANTLPDSTIAAAVSSVADRVIAVDSARRTEGLDALVLGQVELADRTITVRGVSPPTVDAPLPPLEGPPAGTTGEAEDRALAGRAGSELRALVRDAGAARLVRVTGWPAAAVSVEGRPT